MSHHEPTSPLFPKKNMSKYLYERKNATDLNSKEDIRVLCLPESVKEEGKVVVVVQGLKGYLVVENLKKKNDMIDARAMIQNVKQMKRWR